MTTIGSLLRERREPFISFEFFPPSDPAQLPAFYDTAARLKTVDPLFASVTYGAGGGKQQNTLSVTAELVRRGFQVMAHLTCVGAEQERISAFLEDLRAAGVQDVLALRGDAPAGSSAGQWRCWGPPCLRAGTQMGTGAARCGPGGHSSVHQAGVRAAKWRYGPNLYKYRI